MMGRRSIRFEMTFSYSVAMAVMLITVGYAVERLSYNRISASIDHSLRQGAYAVINEMTVFGGDVGNIPSDRATRLLNPPPWPPWYVQLLDTDLNIVHRSRSLGNYTLPVDTAMVRGVVTGMTIAPDLKLHNEEPVRLIAFRLPPIDGRHTGWGQVALSLHELARARRKNRGALFFIIPGGIAISTILGAWLARRALRPIDSVTSSAMRITASNLHERIEPREAHDELGRLIGTLNELFERLESNFQQVNRFSADVSHELRTPLTIIQGEAEVALKQATTDEDKIQTLEVILDEARRMSQLVRNLLTLGRLETGQARPELARIELKQVVEDLTEEGQVMAARKEITLVMGTCDDVDVSGDAVLLHQLGYNLIDNAVKYSPPGGKIELSLVAEGDEARISVRDSGIGIESGERDSIFDRFYRGDKARNHSDGGSGLGLALVQQIAQAHGGSVRVDSRPGYGSEFVVTLPRAGSSADTEGERNNT